MLSTAFVATLNHWIGRPGRMADPRIIMTTVGPGARPTVIGPSRPATSPTRSRSQGGFLIGPDPVIQVRPPRRAAWDEQGWRESRVGAGTVYEGEYVVHSRRGVRQAFRGRIVVNGSAVTAYIADPPSAIKHHPKGPCFQLTQPPWFRVHWRRAATNVDDALLYVERILHEVLK